MSVSKTTEARSDREIQRSPTDIALGQEPKSRKIQNFVDGVGGLVEMRVAHIDGHCHELIARSCIAHERFWIERNPREYDAAGSPRLA